MGFLRSLAQLHRMGREQQRRMDVAGSMADAQSRIDAINASFAGLASPSAAVPSADDLHRPAASSPPANPTRAPHEL